MPGATLTTNCITRSSSVKPSGNFKEQFVGNSVLIGLVLAPPDTAAADRVPAACHIIEDGFCYAQIADHVGQIIRLHPGKSPPTLIIIIAIDE